MAIKTNYVDGLNPSIYVKSRLASNSKEIIAPTFPVVKKKLVTRTGFEPMLTA